MHKQIALAYSIAGLAVAVALLIVIGSSTGLFEDKSMHEATPVQPGAPAAGPLPAPTPMPVPPPPPHQDRTVAQPIEPPVEYVYVDEPLSKKRQHDDDDDDKREREHRESDDD